LNLLFVSTAADKAIIIWQLVNSESKTSDISQALAQQSEQLCWNQYCILKDGHSTGINDIAWSHDSKYLCSAGDDQQVILWSIEEVFLCFAPSGSH